jgi:hypothetical protein
MDRQLTKRQQNAIDRQVDAIVRRRCSGIPIDIMKIGQVFRAAYLAATTGADIETAVVSKYCELAGVPQP